MSDNVNYQLLSLMTVEMKMVENGEIKGTKCQDLCFSCLGICIWFWCPVFSSRLILTCLCIFPVFYFHPCLQWFSLLVYFGSAPNIQSLKALVWFLFSVHFDAECFLHFIVWFLSSFIFDSSVICVSIDRCDWPHTDLLAPLIHSVWWVCLFLQAQSRYPHQLQPHLWALRVPPTWTIVFLLFETIVSVFILL